MIAVRRDRADSTTGRALLTASQDYLRSLYPPEDNHFLSIDALCAPHIAFFVAAEGDLSLGCVALASQGDWGEVKSLYTDPAARGRGVGAVLMQALETEARAQGLFWLRLETGDDLYPAHRLYARQGFRPCGPFGEYAEGPHSVFMEKRL